MTWSKNPGRNASGKDTPKSCNQYITIWRRVLDTRVLTGTEWLLGSTSRAFGTSPAAEGTTGGCPSISSFTHNAPDGDSFLGAAFSESEP